MSWTHTGQRKHSQTGHMGQGKGVIGSYAGFTKPGQLSFNSSSRYCAHKKNVLCCCVYRLNTSNLWDIFRKKIIIIFVTLHYIEKYFNAIYLFTGYIKNNYLKRNS